jgi:hypothetical protein
MAANGMEALFAAAAAAKSAKSSGGSGWKYFQLKDGEKQLVRFVSNDVVPARVFNLRDAKTGKLAEIVDSELESLQNPRHCIVRDYPDIFFGETRKGEKYPKKPTLIGLGMLVKREEYPEVDPETGRRRLKTRDLVEKVKDANGNEVERVVVYLVKASNSTFWENLSDIYIRNDGNITTRDIQISRKGATTDTKYNFLPNDKEEWSEPGEAEAHYRELLGDDAFPDVEGWIESKASESWYKKALYPMIPELADQAEGEDGGEEAEKPVESSEEKSSTVSSVSELMKKQREARKSA